MSLELTESNVSRIAEEHRDRDTELHHATVEDKTISFSLLESEVRALHRFLGDIPVMTLARFGGADAGRLTDIHGVLEAELELNRD